MFVSRQALESLELIQWVEYAKLVAEAYAAAPVYDPAAVPAYAAAARDVEHFFRMISSKVKVEFVDYDPYKSSSEMQAAVRHEKVLRVMTLYSQHPFFTEEQNWKFRAVHDWFTHILAHQEFTQKGEIQAYNTHTKMFSQAAVPALFTEVVGQVCYQSTRGSFPPQKVAILPGFDYWHLGRVEGFVIQKKQLVPKPPVTYGSSVESRKQAFLGRLQATLQEIAGRDEAKRPHPCSPEKRFEPQSRRCVPVASMMTRGRK